jgi:MYXO-CTERM domain-containing protein
LPLEGPPIDVVKFTSADRLPVAQGTPPLVDDRLLGELPRNYVLYGAAFGALLIAGGFLRRRRR